MDSERFTWSVEFFQRRRPFVPFTILMNSGRSYEVDHANAMSLMRDGMALLSLPGGRPVLFDHEGVSEIVGDLKSNLE